MCRHEASCKPLFIGKGNRKQAIATTGYELLIKMDTK